MPYEREARQSPPGSALLTLPMGHSERWLRASPSRRSRRVCGLRGLCANNFRLAIEIGFDALLKMLHCRFLYAKQQGHSLLELAMSWIAGRPGVASVIAGATKPEQLEQNVAATGWILTAEELAAVDQTLA